MIRVYRGCYNNNAMLRYFIKASSLLTFTVFKGKTFELNFDSKVKNRETRIFFNNKKTIGNSDQAQ